MTLSCTIDLVDSVADVALFPIRIIPEAYHRFL